MDWILLAQIIAKEGLPVAETIYKKWSSKAPPTPADFDELRALGKQTAQDRMKANLAQAGIPLDDPKAIALLALTA